MTSYATAKEFLSVVDAEGRQSIWPVHLPVPGGWRVGHRGSRRECLDHIERGGAVPPARSAQRGGPGLLDLFAATVDRFGDRPAISDAGHRLTYRELDARSSALAATLAGAGVGPGDRVAFHLGRGAGVFVAMLGILKAGAAYVPVDIRYPDWHRNLMLKESRARLLITDAEHRGGAESAGVPVVTPRFDMTVTDGLSAAAQVGGGDPAAVLFTSGSSGRAKAVVLTHRNVAHFARNPRLPRLLPADRTGHVSSLSFDAFHFETWCSFAAGAEIVVLPAMPDLIEADVQFELRRQRISVMLAPTMAVNHIVREDRDAFATLRVLCTGGDVISPAACRELLAGAFAGEFHNLYGPTEATTACTSHPIRAVGADDECVPIGRPLAGCAVYLLDGDLQPVPEGEVGEIYVGGDGVAEGYLDQPGLTAERFLPDPFSGDGRRMYATGDLARRGANGLLEFRGRADDQVKIRGYRVEPQAVERAVGRHPGVREVAVVVSGNGDDRYLVALVVQQDDLHLKDLRRYAEENLPDYLVPAALIRVAEIPGDAHGKRDQGKLRRLAAEHLDRTANLVPPRDDVERYLAGLWEELLAVERIGVSDDFFGLGGNSLLAFRAQRRIVRDLGLTLSPRDVLRNSELGQLAALVRERKGASAS